MDIYTRELVKKGAKFLPKEIVMIQLLEKMNWSYEDYLNTPQRLIDLIIEKNNLDNKFYGNSK